MTVYVILAGSADFDGKLISNDYVSVVRTEEEAKRKINVFVQDEMAMAKMPILMTATKQTGLIPEGAIVLEDGFVGASNWWYYKKEEI